MADGWNSVRYIYRYERNHFAKSLGVFFLSTRMKYIPYICDQEEAEEKRKKSQAWFSLF